MKLRAKTNGNIIERDGEEAKALVATGIYEEVKEADDEDVTQRRIARTYRRRDMQAEK